MKNKTKNKTDNESIIEQAKEITQKALDDGEEVMPTCLAFRKDDVMEIIMVPFKNFQEKEKVRTFLKEHLVKTPIEKYAVICDVKMTTWDIKDKDMKKEPKVKDCIMISIYSAQDKLTRMYPYEEKEKKLIEADMVEMKGRSGKDKADDSWDIWGKEPSKDSKITKEYIEFKKTHRELYRGLEKEEDEIYDLKTKGKLEVFDMAMGFSMKIYRMDDRVLFEAINGSGKTFMSTKAMDDDDEFKKKLNEAKTIIKMLGDKFENN